MPVDMPTVTLYNWVRSKWVKARQLVDEPRTPWVIRADAREIKRLRALRAAPKSRWATVPPVVMT